MCFSSFAEYYCANHIAFVKGKYHFGTIDCTEGEVGTCVVMILTSLFGSCIWEYHVNLKNKHLILVDFSLKQFL